MNTKSEYKETQKVAHGLINKINEAVLRADATSESLFGGELARTFYLTYMYEHSNKKEFEKETVKSFEKVIHAFNKGDAKLYGPYLCNGVTGLLFVTVLLIKKGLIDDDYIQEFHPLIDYLTDCAIVGIDCNNNDFLHGSFGTVFTMAEFANISGNHKNLKKLINKLERKYANTEMPWILSGPDKESAQNKINFSLSHGQSGLLLVLFHAYNILGETKRRKSAYLKRNVEYLIESKNEDYFDKTYSYYPSILDVKDGKRNASNRLAWCYGDLGNVLSLNHASSFYNKKSYSEIVNEIGIKTTSRKSYEETFIADPYLCHGTAGVAQLYKILFDKTGIVEYESAYKYWIKETVQLGQKELLNAIDEKKVLNLAEGLPGLGLTLMSYLSQKHLDWGNVMLIR
jgi:hypothetical protein